MPVDYCILNNQIRPKDHAAILRPFLPSKYLPLQESGDGLQSVYLAELPPVLADAWGIDAGVRVGDFSREQNAYLDYHRVNVFKHALVER